MHEIRNIPEPEEIRAAARTIAPHAHRTPVHTSSQINRRTGCEVFFKCENFQRTGSFKFRGACNAVFTLSEGQAAAGIVTHSSGNHAQAVSLAAAIRGIPAHVVMPENAPRNKVAAVESYGARITFCTPTLAAREQAAADLVRRTGARFIHPYNDPAVIAGQGTAAMELLEDVPDLDLIIAPVGGGGLIGGTAIAAKSMNREIRIIAAEPEQADDAFRSFREKRLIRIEAPDTIADGLRTSLGELTFAILCSKVDDVITAGEESIIAEMKTVFERLKLVIEPSSALPLAVLSGGKMDTAGKKTGIILSGGNADLARLPWQTGRP